MNMNWTLMSDVFLFWGRPGGFHPGQSFFPSRSAGPDMPSVSKRFQPLDIGVFLIQGSFTWLLSNGNMSFIWGYDWDMMGIELLN
jgi:hypothetical protein